MKSTQLEQVLLLLGRSHKQVTKIVNLNPNSNIRIRYTAYCGAPENVQEYVSKRNLSSTSLWVLLVVDWPVKELRWMSFGGSRLHTPQVYYKNTWFYLLAAPLKSGPACFVEHVVL